MRRSKFSLSHYHILSCDMGELVPCGVVEVLPGDSLQQVTSALVRVSPLLAPVMHPVHVRIHSWFVPHRIVWDDFEDFITGGPDGEDASVFPTIDLSGAAVGSLADYMGVPTGLAAGKGSVSALPFRAYNLIWNEWYRDQDLQTELVIDKTSGVDTTTETDLQKVAWEKDYFTSSRPWETKGADVTIPLTGDAPIKGIGVQTDNDSFSASPTLRETDGTERSYTFGGQTQSNGKFWIEGDAATDGAPQIFADLSEISGIGINELREALAKQRYQEARARYGSRYVEYLRYLGVRSSDGRLDRPEYLGGGRQTLQFSEVLQTAEGTNPVGELRGHGISAIRSNRYRRFFEEHGYVITTMSIRPKTIYQDGIPRHLSRTVKEDFWQKELQHIGQQAVLNKEVYANHATPDGTFGYQDRYDEYRRCESRISGEFRDTTLNFWHLARQFASDPSLNDTFVECLPSKRTFAAQSNDVMWVMAMNSIQARRMLAKTGTSYTF